MGKESKNVEKMGKELGRPNSPNIWAFLSSFEKWEKANFAEKALFFR